MYHWQEILRIFGFLGFVIILKISCTWLSRNSWGLGRDCLGDLWVVVNVRCFPCCKTSHMVLYCRTRSRLGEGWEKLLTYQIFKSSSCVSKETNLMSSPTSCVLRYSLSVEKYILCIWRVVICIQSIPHRAGRPRGRWRSDGLGILWLENRRTGDLCWGAILEQNVDNFSRLSPFSWDP